MSYQDLNRQRNQHTNGAGDQNSKEKTNSQGHIVLAVCPRAAASASTTADAVPNPTISQLSRQTEN